MAGSPDPGYIEPQPSHAGGDFGSSITSTGPHPAVHASDVGGMLQVRQSLYGRNGIPVAAAMEPDGYTCGRRQYGMLCYVIGLDGSTPGWYQLRPAGFFSLGTDAAGMTARRAALANNANWVAIELGTSNNANDAYQVKTWDEMIDLQGAFGAGTTYRITGRVLVGSPQPDVVIEALSATELAPSGFSFSGTAGAPQGGEYDLLSNVFVPTDDSFLLLIDYQGADEAVTQGAGGLEPGAWYRLYDRPALATGGPTPPDVLLQAASATSFRATATELRATGPVDGTYDVGTNLFAPNVAAGPMTWNKITGDPRSNPELNALLSLLEDALAEREYVLVAGSNVTISRNALTRTTTISATGGGSGTVTSVSLAIGASASDVLSVAGSPITTTGTFTVSFQSQTANTVLAAPNGAAGTPTFRLLVAADIPSLPASRITSGTLAAARLASGTLTAGFVPTLQGDGSVLWQAAAGGGGTEATTAQMRTGSDDTTRVSPRRFKEEADERLLNGFLTVTPSGAGAVVLASGALAARGTTAGIYELRYTTTVGGTSGWTSSSSIPGIPGTFAVMVVSLDSGTGNGMADAQNLCYVVRNTMGVDFFIQLPTGTNHYYTAAADQFMRVPQLSGSKAGMAIITCQRIGSDYIWGGGRNLG